MKRFIKAAVFSILLVSLMGANAPPPPEEWVGKDLQFTEKSASGNFTPFCMVARRKDLKAYDKGEWKMPKDLFLFSELADKKGTVIDCKNDKTSFVKIVKIQSRDDIILCETTHGRSLPDVFFLEELELARSMVGKEIYASLPMAKRYPGLGNYEALKIAKASPPEGAVLREDPLVFLLKKEDGQTITWQGKLTSINVDADAPDNPEYFFEVWLQTDPLAGRDWNSRYLLAIREGKVMAGMTPEMVTLSWGPPDETVTSAAAQDNTEKWVYGETALVFKDGSLAGRIDK